MAWLQPRAGFPVVSGRSNLSRIAGGRNAILQKVLKARHAGCCCEDGSRVNIPAEDEV